MAELNEDTSPVLASPEVVRARLEKYIDHCAAMASASRAALDTDGFAEAAALVWETVQEELRAITLD